jgi:hypothetical protein
LCACHFDNEKSPRNSWGFLGIGDDGARWAGKKKGQQRSDFVEYQGAIDKNPTSIYTVSEELTM